MHSQRIWWVRMLVNQISFIQRFFSILRAGALRLQQVTHHNRLRAKEAQLSPDSGSEAPSALIPSVLP
jgi:hypothetical protein